MKSPHTYKAAFFALVGIFLMCGFLKCSAHVPESVKAIGIYTSSIALGAIGDGLNFRGYSQGGDQSLGHICDALSTGILLMSPLFLDMEKWWWSVISYVSLRIALFDPLFNISAGLPLNYRGVANVWDKSVGLKMWHRSAFLIIGVAIPINRL